MLAYEPAAENFRLLALNAATHPAIEAHRAAVWRRDGFASLDAGDAPGTLTTPPLAFTGTRLELNFAAGKGGSARVALLDAGGRPLAGFGEKDGEPLTQDATAQAVRWPGRADLSALQGKPVRLLLPDGATVTGKVAGVDASGALVLADGPRRARFLSGEITLRRA